MRKIVIFGFGEGGKQAFSLLASKHRVVAFCDTRPHDLRNYEQVPIILPNELRNYQFDKVVVASMYVKQSMSILLDSGIPNSKIEVYETVRILIDKRLQDGESLLAQLYQHNSDSRTSLAAIVDHLAKQDPSSFIPDQWCCIYDFLVSQAQFDLALPIREKALAALEEAEVSEELYLGLLDKGQLSQAQAILPEVQKKRGLNPEVLQALYFLYAGDYEHSQAVASSFIDHGNSTGLIVNGKSVAIVGPSQSTNNAGLEIDQFDVVVRLSPSHLDAEEHHSIGSRTNIVYVGAHAPSYMQDQALSTLNRQDIHFVFESVLDPGQHRQVEKGLARKVEYSVRLFNGIPNFLQRILIDLFFVGANEIKLFNFDFYTKKQHYQNKYKTLTDREKYSNRPENHLLQSQAVLHDFATQFNFCKKMLQNGSIDLDDVTRSVLSLSLEDYFGKLGNSFCYSGRREIWKATNVI